MRVGCVDSQSVDCVKKKKKKAKRLERSLQKNSAGGVLGTGLVQNFQVLQFFFFVEWERGWVSRRRQGHFISYFYIPATDVLFFSLLSLEFALLRRLVEVYEFGLAV